MVALLSNAGALGKEVSRLYRDVGRLHGRSKAMHRVTGRLHLKIAGDVCPNSDFPIAKSGASS